MLALSVAAADLLREPPQTAVTSPQSPISAGTQPETGDPFLRDLPRRALEWGMTFLAPLLLNLLIESSVVALSGRGSSAAWKAGLLANTLTHPIAVLLMIALGPTVLRGSTGITASLFIGALEVGVVLAEWRVYGWVLGWPNRRALSTSAMANGLSFALGLLLGERFPGF